MASLPPTWRKLAAEQAHALRETRRVRRAVSRRVLKSPQLDGPTSAKVAGLRYVNEHTTAGIRRLGAGRHVRYADTNGRPVRNREVLTRIRSLAIPPAWTDVWICPNPLGHLQATGRDARGRKQYRYHQRWREVRDQVKYGRLIAFAQALPRIRARTARDLKRPGLPREKVLAAVVQLLEKTLIRVGNEEYARENHSFGLTTMRDQHAKIGSGMVRFEFRGKSGINHSVDLHDARLARIVKACRDLPGYELFQYLDESGKRLVVDSADVNAYLREITGEDFTAKDFRTWAGTVLAAKALAAMDGCSSKARAKKNVVAAVEKVAMQLGNTRAVCRKCYIHPVILDAYVDGATIETVKARTARAVAGTTGLTADEQAVARFITARLTAPMATAADRKTA